MKKVQTMEPHKVERWQHDGRLYHVFVEGQYEALCGKILPSDAERPRFFRPSDENACARCCKRAGILYDVCEDQSPQPTLPQRGTSQ